jgi:hypothetical protein
MKRFTIRGMMAVIVLVAVDCGIIHEMDSFMRASATMREFADLAMVGLVPMANVLALGLLALRGSAKHRPFLTGFAVFGFGAWFLTIIVCSVASREIHNWIGDSLSVFRGFPPLFLVLAGAILVVPQLIVAVLGGRYYASNAVTGKYKTPSSDIL